MPNFLPYDYHQGTMVVINFEDQILAGTFEYALHYLIEHKVDLSAFNAAYCNDDQGRPAFKPAILLKIILFAYSRGISSSRQIQWCCQGNILFKALSCDTTPAPPSLLLSAVMQQPLLTCLNRWYRCVMSKV